MYFYSVNLWGWRRMLKEICSAFSGKTIYDILTEIYIYLGNI